MQRMRKIGCAAAAVAAAALFVTVPAASADEGDVELGFADENYNGFREVHGSGDDAYWSIRIRSSGGYVATWERDEGVWNSPQEALKQINEGLACSYAVTERLLDSVSSTDEYSRLPQVIRYENDDGGFSVALAEDSAEYAEKKKCTEGRSWDWSATPSEETDEAGVGEVRVPVSVVGPGVHRMFLQQVEDGDLVKHEYADGSWISYTPTRVAVGDPVWVTVAIPEPLSADFPHTAKVANGDIAEPSILASAAAPFESGPDAFVTEAGAGLAAAASAAVLVGIPTLLAGRKTRRNRGESNE